jgi:hypothetical protein
MLDNQAWELLGMIFSQDASVTFGDEPAIEGLESIRAALSVRKGFDATQHIVGNETFTIGNNSAESTCRVLGHLVREDRVLHFGGKYEDRLIKLDDLWVITSRKYIEIWSDGDSSVFADAVQRSKSL